MTAFHVLQYIHAPLPEGARLVFKPSELTLRTRVHILAALSQSFILPQRINWILGYLVCGCLSDDLLWPRSSLWPPRTLEFLSWCPCSGFQNLVWLQMSHTCLWREMFIWAFLPSAPAISLLLWYDLLLSPLSFLVHKKKSSNKTVCLRVKVLQI